MLFQVAGQIYELNAIIEHHGFSRRSGLYVAYIDHAGKTFRIDDTVVGVRSCVGASERMKH